MKSIYIALATYNGEPYLRQLIESIRRQSMENWTLLVRDDCSTDHTPAILRQFTAEDNRIIILDSQENRLGSAMNFGFIAQEAFQRNADYLFFADQDDIWLPDKLENLLSLIQDAERTAGDGASILAFSDMTVVNQDAEIVHPSFLAHSRLHHDVEKPLPVIIGRCFVLGCSCAINRPLMEFALPIPPCAASHDWWIALCAAAMGKIAFRPDPTLLYRRHGKNTSGPAGFWGGFNPLRYSWSRRWQIGTKSFRQSIAQTRALKDRLTERLKISASKEIDLLENFFSILDHPSGIDRIRKLRQLGVPDIDLPRRLLYYLCVLTQKYDDD